MHVVLYDANGNPRDIENGSSLITASFGNAKAPMERLNEWRLCGRHFRGDGRYWGVWECNQLSCAGFSRITLSRESGSREVNFNHHWLFDPRFCLDTVTRQYRSQHSLYRPCPTNNVLAAIQQIMHDGKHSTRCGWGYS